MFYTKLTVYAEVPDKNTALELQAKGYKIMINDNNKLAGELRNIEGVVYKNFTFSILNK